MPTIIEEDIKSALTGLTVYPLSVPTDGVYPCVVYQIISDVQNRYHGGNSLRKLRVQLTVHAKSYSSCLTNAYTVKGLIDLNRTNFELATKENEIQAKENESGDYSAILDFFIWTPK